MLQLAAMQEAGGEARSDITEAGRNGNRLRVRRSIRRVEFDVRNMKNAKA